MYKESQYNYFVPYKNGRVIYYNAVTRKCFDMSETEHKQIQTLFADPISFDLCYPSVFQEFINLGFFIEENYEEIAFLRYRYNQETVYNSEFHVVLCINKTIENPQTYINKIKLHIDMLFHTNIPPLFCLEWNGIALSKHFYDICLPILHYAKEKCNHFHITFHPQVATKINLEEKNIINMVKELCVRVPYCIFLIRLNSNKSYEELHMPSSIKNLLIDFKSTQNTIWDTKNFTLAPLCVVCDFRESDLWYPLKSPRINQYTIDCNGNVYLGKPFYAYIQPIGALTDNGTIQWNNQLRIQTLGNPWFEKEKCKRCKHLFLYSPICSQLHTNLCCTDLNIISIEDVIVSEFNQIHKKQ